MPASEGELEAKLAGAEAALAQANATAAEIASNVRDVNRRHRWQWVPIGLLAFAFLLLTIAQVVDYFERRDAKESRAAIQHVVETIEDCQVPSNGDGVHQCYEDDQQRFARFIRWGIECLNEERDADLDACIVEKERAYQA